MKYIIIGIIVLVGIWTSAFIAQSKNDREFSAWGTKCLQDGGITTLDKVSFSSDHYECIKDGKIINHVK